MQAAESRIKSLQSSGTRKDSTIKELRSKLDQSKAAAASEAADEALEAQAKQMAAVRATLSRKEAALKALQADLERERDKGQQVREGHVY